MNCDDLRNLRMEFWGFGRTIRARRSASWILLQDRMVGGDSFALML